MIRTRTSFIITALIAILLLCLPTTAVASNGHDEEENVIEANVGVSFECPDDENEGDAIKGVSTPTKVWDISKKGKYNYSGDPGGQTLYTNYKFKGKTSYTFYVKNTGKYPLTVKAKRKTKTYASTKVSAGKSATVTFSNIKKTTEFYMTFKGSKFKGYIK